MHILTPKEKELPDENIYERLHSGEFDTPENEYGKTSYHGYGADRLIEKEISVLDVGAGRTPWLSILKAAKNLSRAVATDISASAIKYQIETLKVEAYQCNILQMPFPDNEFDVVTCFDVIEHLEESRIAEAIKELFRVSKGKLILNIGTGSSIWGGTELHITQKTYDEWVYLISKLGYVKSDGPFLILTNNI